MSLHGGAKKNPWRISRQDGVFRESIRSIKRLPQYLEADARMCVSSWGGLYQNGRKSTIAEKYT